MRADKGGRFSLADGEYYLVTCHRAENVDDPARLKALFEILVHLDRPIVYPVHPRTRKNFIRQQILRFVHRTHPTLAEFGQNLVPVRKPVPGLWLSSRRRSSLFAHR